MQTIMIGLVFAQQFDERARVEFVESEPATFILPGRVKLVINPTGYFGDLVHEFDVSFGIQMAEDFVGVIREYRCGEPPVHRPCLYRLH